MIEPALEPNRPVSVRWSPIQRWLIVCAVVAIAVSFNLNAVVAQDNQSSQPPADYETRGIPAISAGGNADSNNRMIAVTGLDVTGQSVLYLIDTETQQLCVYQASGGANSTRGLRFVAARNIGLDMQLDGFNDKTETRNGRPLRYSDLEEQFRSNGLLEDEEQ